MAPRRAAPAAPALLLALLALLALSAAAAPAPASPSECSLALDPSELDRLGRALASTPKKYLEIARQSGEVTGVKAAALAAAGFSAAAVDCLVATYAEGSDRSAPAASAGGGVSAADKAKVLAYFGKKSNQKAWKGQVADRFGKQVSGRGRARVF
jgi:hypothetical protein